MWNQSAWAVLCLTGEGNPNSASSGAFLQGRGGATGRDRGILLASQLGPPGSSASRKNRLLQLPSRGVRSRGSPPRPALRHLSPCFSAPPWAGPCLMVGVSDPHSCQGSRKLSQARVAGSLDEASMYPALQPSTTTAGLRENSWAGPASPSAHQQASGGSGDGKDFSLPPAWA